MFLVNEQLSMKVQPTFPVQAVLRQKSSVVFLARKMQFRMYAVHVNSQDLHEVDLMTDVILTIKVMPDGTEIDMAQLENIVREKVSALGNISEIKEEPVAFGLKALLVTFSMDEEKGDTEELEKDISAIDGVSSVAVISVSRALG